MGKTFEDTDGEVWPVDFFNGVDFDEDIVTGEISRYYVTLDGEPKNEIDEEVYEALKKHYK